MAKTSPSTSSTRSSTAATRPAAKAIRDFTAFNLAGEEVRLRDVLRENKYTLVEFWASWCGPCIAEIPHLQEAYERFRGNGFEILAVNLDDDPENWRVASEEDYDINWLNVSDNQAFGSPVAKLYRVKAIPANFLVSTGGQDGVEAPAGHERVRDLGRTTRRIANPPGPRDVARSRRRGVLAALARRVIPTLRRSSAVIRVARHLPRPSLLGAPLRSPAWRSAAHGRSPVHGASPLAEIIKASSGSARSGRRRNPRPLRRCHR